MHKGEASHGHYYCFMYKPGIGWFRIDDEKVQPFDLEKGVVDKHPPPCNVAGPSPASSKGGAASEELSALAEECFGGMDSTNKALGKKVRNHNAFVLLYQRAADRQFRGSVGHPSHDDAMSSSSSDAPRSPAPTHHADPAVKDLQAALQSLPDHRLNGTHPDLEEVLDSNLQYMCREILFDPSFSGQVLDFIEAQLQLNAVSPDDLLCMGKRICTIE